VSLRATPTSTWCRAVADRDAEAAARFGAPPGEGFTSAPALVQPTAAVVFVSRARGGRNAPIIEAIHLGTDEDLAAIVKAIEAARELETRKRSMACVKQEVVPGPGAKTRKDLEDLATDRRGQFRARHRNRQDGDGRGCGRGPELRVHGLRGLRVADASVMPTITSGRRTPQRS